STRRRSSPIRRAGTACASACARRSSGACNRAMPSGESATRSEEPDDHVSANLDEPGAGPLQGGRDPHGGSVAGDRDRGAVMTASQPIKIAILAMGGEGGGVLADWIVDLAEHNGSIGQTTSVPGVAQPTGATIYYVELYPEAQARADGGTPVLALMPLPGDVDVVLASELME